MNNTIEFSPNDYFSSSNLDYAVVCKNRKPINCTAINLDNSNNCINEALCHNYEARIGIANTNNSVSETEGRYIDSLSKYNKTMIHTTNLSVGVIGLLVIIYMYI